MNPRKPHSTLKGFLREVKVKRGGHAVLFDGATLGETGPEGERWKIAFFPPGSDAPSDARWYVRRGECNAPLKAFMREGWTATTTVTASDTEEVPVEKEEAPPPPRPRPTPPPPKKKGPPAPPPEIPDAVAPDGWTYLIVWGSLKPRIALVRGESDGHERFKRFKTAHQSYTTWLGMYHEAVVKAMREAPKLRAENVRKE